jgi:hypothetical protein
MAPRARKLFRARTAHALIVLAILAGLAGGGWSISNSSSPTRASADPDASAPAPTPTAASSCAVTVLDTLGAIAARVYREGVSSERTASALHLIAGSRPLRAAVERSDARATRDAAQALLATGHMTNLRVLRGGQTLADVGGPALAPLSGTLTGAGGAPIASFVTSVWADSGLVDELDGITEGQTALRGDGPAGGGQSIAGSFALPADALPAKGALAVRGVDYQYTSFPVAVYPTGQLRVYVLRAISSTASLCGHSPQEALVNTLSHVASLIYAGEGGRRALVQVHRVQHDQALLSAVAHRDPLAARAAIEALLNQHIVRLRVNAGGRLLSDVGGPFVLAPVTAPLRLDGRTIGDFVLSIQDDEGYLRLTHRLAGLDVLMYMGSRLVKNSLGPNPGTVPDSGPYRYRGHTFSVFTLHLDAFPAGPLRTQVLVPIPYS